MSRDPGESIFSQEKLLDLGEIGSRTKKLSAKKNKSWGGKHPLVLIGLNKEFAYLTHSRNGVRLKSKFSIHGNVFSMPVVMIS